MNHYDALMGNDRETVVVTQASRLNDRGPAIFGTQEDEEELFRGGSAVIGDVPVPVDNGSRALGWGLAALAVLGVWCAVSSGGKR